MKTIKKHNRRQIGKWKEKTIQSYWIYLYVGGNYETSERACRELCFPSGLCVTIEKIKYVFGGGSEDGVRVGFIQYPPFPEEEKVIMEKAIILGKQIAKANFQFSFTLVTPTKTMFFSRVK